MVNSVIFSHNQSRYSMSYIVVKKNKLEIQQNNGKSTFGQTKLEKSEGVWRENKEKVRVVRLPCNSLT